jgi:hypothetical protein
MLSDEVIEKVIERLTRRIQKTNVYIIEQIGKSIKKVGTLSISQAQQIAQIMQYGGDFNKIVQALADMTKLSVNDIYDIFNEIARYDYEFARQFYEYRNINYIPFDENIALKTQVEALARQTAEQFVNLTKTMAFASVQNGEIVYSPIAQVYHDILDKAVLSVGQGKESFDQSMYRSLKELSQNGIKVVEYESGKTLRLDSAVRMQMRDALRTLHNHEQQIIGEQFDSDGVEISVHLNPAPDHENVQGKQFSNSEFEKFQNDQDSVSYDGTEFSADFENHDRRSVGQYNCYHYVFSIVLGVSKPQYTNEQLQDIIDTNNKGFEFDGKHYTNYQGTQLQRRIETEIRKQKDIQIMGKASGNMELVNESQKKITQLTQKYKKLCNESGLLPKMKRMRVSGYKRVNVNNISKNQNKEIIAYHSSPIDFKEFDERYIRPDDTDYVFNGFFFTEKQGGSSPYENANYVTKAKLDLSKLATKDDVLDTLKELNEKYDVNDESQIPQRSRYWGDEIRYMLLDKGFDGMQTRGVNLKEAQNVLSKSNVYEYTTPLGSERKIIKNNNKYDYYENNNLIYKYDDLLEWKEDNPTEWVVFDKNKIKIIDQYKK